MVEGPHYPPGKGQGELLGEVNTIHNLYGFYTQYQLKVTTHFKKQGDVIEMQEEK